MRRIDLGALNILEKFSRWTQKWFGLNNFFWVRVCCLFAVFYAVQGLINIASDPKQDAFCETQACCSYVILSVATFFMVFWTEKDVNKHPRYENELKISFYSCRLLPVLMLVVYSFDSVAGLDMCPKSLTFVSLSAYLLCCTPLPPSDSKVKQLIKEGLRKARKAIVPNTVPVPLKG
ncbi:hypothetical protein ACFL08_00635 [Patescibacteria group bacterium]